MKHPEDCCDVCMVYDDDGNWTGYSGDCESDKDEIDSCTWCGGDIGGGVSVNKWCP